MSSAIVPLQRSNRHSGMGISRIVRLEMNRGISAIVLLQNRFMVVPSDTTQSRVTRPAYLGLWGDGMYSSDSFEPEVVALATAVFDRSWGFIERDPVLVGEDRQSTQEELARLILVLIRRGEKDLVAIANCAILTLRQQCAARRTPNLVEEFA
jgi:hypothetical protein